jgi:hypothetical protein
VQGKSVSELTVTRSSPVPGDGSVPEVPSNARVWRDHREFPNVYGYSHDGDHWLWLPGKAAFRFDTAGRQVEAIVPDATSDRRVEELYQRHAMRFVLQARGRELLHASAVLTPRGAIAFVGSSGAGKSTMAFALSQRGYPPVADDALLFEIVGEAVQLHPLPFSLQVSNEPALGEGEAPAQVDAPNWSDDSLPRLAAVFAIERISKPNPERGPEVIALSSAAAFQLLLYHAHCFSHDDDDRRRLMFERYLELTARVPVFRIRNRPALKQLPDFLDTVEAVVR